VFYSSIIILIKLCYDTYFRMKNVVLWDLTMCSLVVDSDQCNGEYSVSIFSIQKVSQETDVAASSEMFIPVHQTTRHHIPDSCDLK
jgi:hypothetical protein